jgi:hypothetical protein
MLTFPIKTVKDIFINYKKHSIDHRVEFMTPLCVENDRVVLGKTIKTGSSYKIEGHISQKEQCWGGEWIGEIHSHVDMKDKEHFAELEKGMSEDDINHIISSKFEGVYKKFPVLFCAATPTKNTSSEFWLEVQCEKYNRIDDEDLYDIKRAATPIKDPLGAFRGYPAGASIGTVRISSISNHQTEVIQDDNIARWKAGDGNGRWGYPFPVDVNKFEEELHRTGGITTANLPLAFKATLYYQAEMASIKKGLREKGLLTSDEFTIKCKKIPIGRQKKTIMACSYAEQKLNL